jgi:hypothetical protein
VSVEPRTYVRNDALQFFKRSVHGIPVVLVSSALSKALNKRFRGVVPMRESRKESFSE